MGGEITGAAPESRDTITEHFVRAQAKWLLASAQEHINSGGGWSPHILVACTVDPKDGKTPVTAEHSIVPVVMGPHPAHATEYMRGRFLESARALAIAGRAYATILCVETWMVVRDTFTREEAERIAASTKPDVAENRRETLVCQIEWADRDPEASALYVVRDQGFVDYDEVPVGNFCEVSGDGSIMLPPGTEVPDHIQQCAIECVSEMLITLSEMRRRQGHTIAEA